MTAAHRFAGVEPVDGPIRPVLDVAASATGRVWVDRLDPRRHPVALAIAQRNGLPEIVARVLAARGVDPEEAAEYLDPTLRRLMPDPSTLVDMDAVADRLADAVTRGEAVTIFGDYDVDGATSSALLALVLRDLGLEPAVYIPDRLVDGYGPNPRVVADLAAGGTRLLVTLDCGTHSFEAFEAARRAGLDVVTVDHHQAGLELPPVRALVNPNRHDDLSGLGHLAAVGLTFLTAVALTRTLRRRGWFARSGRAEPDLLALTDLVALGTVCDVVPLTGLNRAYVVKGLAAMRGRRNRGLAALADVVRLSGPPSAYHLGFLIGPRINAGGRIGDAALGARLLMSDDPVEAGRIAAELDRLNRERQAMEAAALEEAEALVAAELATADPAVVVAASQDWHPGIVGLVAARLKERHNRPAFAVAIGPDGTATGSARSVPGVDIGRVVREAVEAGILAKGGGHAMAAGVTLDPARLPDLSAFVDERVRAGVAVAMADRALAIDGVVTASGATADLVGMLERAGPFGAGQPDPVFVLPAHRVTWAETAGHGHLRVQLQSADGSKIKAMAFRAAGQPLGDMIAGARGRALHVAGVLGLDHWQGEARPQLRIVDAADPTR
jgi:single-stranded-DNA-specific exonuclease